MAKHSTLCPQCFNGTVDTTTIHELSTCTRCTLQFYVDSHTRVVNPFSRNVRPKKPKKDENNGFLGTGIQYREVVLPKRIIRKKKRVRRKKKK
jgi:hypothetical protein